MQKEKFPQPQQFNFNIIKTDQNNFTNQSCPPIIQQDITKSRNQYSYEQQIGTRAKSQEFKHFVESQEDEERNGLNQNSIRNNQVRSEIKKEKIIKEKPSSEKNLQKRELGEYKGGTDFGVDKVESDQQSVQGLSLNSFSDRSERVRHQGRKSLELYQKNKEKFQNLNILVAGAADTGKSTFIRCFQRRQRKKESPLIKSRTKQLRYETGFGYEDNFKRRNNVNFIDVPGFNQSNVSRYIKEIQIYAARRWQEHSESQLVEDDTRVHCCLYFLQGPHIKQTDLDALRLLTQMFSVIPLIAKSDCYTVQEIRQFKQQFKQKTENQLGRRFLNIDQLIGIKIGWQEKERVMVSEFGRYPPFAVASSCQRQINEGKFIRQYPWGRVEVENQRHTELTKLIQLLTDQLRTEIISNAPRVEFPVEESESVIPEQTKPKKRLGPFIAVGLMTFLLGCLSVNTFNFIKVKLDPKI